jgi:hypothetical protein
MAPSRNTSATPGSFPPAALADAAVRARRRLFAALDVPAEVYRLGIVARPFHDAVSALDLIASVATVAAAAVVERPE